MRHSFSATVLVTALLLAGCSAPGDDNAAADDSAGMEDSGTADPVAPAPPAAGNDRAPGNGTDDDDDGDDDDGGLAIIPARFHGEWNSDRVACGSGASETRLRVSGDRLRFYESVGTVRRVDVESDRVIDVTAQYQGEGQTWQNERRLSLSADGDSLTVSGEGSRLVRYRCG